MFMDLKEVVPDPIKGNPDVAFRVEFSRLDAERGFIESQDRETAMLAMLTGDEELLSQSSSLDYSECANRLLPPLATCPPSHLPLHLHCPFSPPFSSLHWPRAALLTRAHVAPVSPPPAHLPRYRLAGTPI